MRTSEHINEIAAALAKAQGEMENPVKNANNQHYKNDYADLSAVLAAVRPVLSKHGISIVQASSIEGENLILHTRLYHTSGQWFESIHPISKVADRPQAIGGNETYARRYSLAAICGIAQADDDLKDGKSAPQAAPPKPQEQAPRRHTIPSDDRIKEFRADTYEKLNLCESTESLEAFWKSVKSNVPDIIRNEIIEAFGIRRKEIEAITSETDK